MGRGKGSGKVRGCFGANNEKKTRYFDQEIEVTTGFLIYFNEQIPALLFQFNTLVYSHLLKQLSYRHILLSQLHQS